MVQREAATTQDKGMLIVHHIIFMIKILIWWVVELLVEPFVSFIWCVENTDGEHDDRFVNNRILLAAWRD